MESLESVLVVSPNVEDDEFSMYKYAELIERCYRAIDVPCERKCPPRIMRRLGKSKWFGYFDWFVVAPLYYNILFRKHSTVHIVDHSKAYLVFLLFFRKIIVTCHDMIAIRSAVDKTDIALSWLGKKLQKLCLRGLKAANLVIAVSNTTKNEYGKYSSVDNCKVLLSAMNDEYKDLRQNGHLSPFSDNGRYFFHVGSNLKRKNREGIIRSFAKTFAHENGVKLVFAGAPLDSSTIDIAKNCGVYASIVDIGRVTYEELNYLYSSSIALVFLSFSEGFGWPIIEAQSSGTAVISSNKESLGEIASMGAILVEPADYDSVSEAMDKLTEESEFRENLIKEGFSNAAKYSFAQMSQKLKEIVRD